MSIFTNRADAARDEAEAYIRAVLELLGDRDPMGVLETMPAELEGRLEGLEEEQLRRPEAPGKWSMLEVVQHLADSDLVWAYRLRTVVADEKPQIRGYDQDRWAERLCYGDVPIEDAVGQFRALRGINLRFLRSLAPQDLERVGVHIERGEESVQHMIRLEAGHDLIHLRQLERIRAQASA